LEGEIVEDIEQPEDLNLPPHILTDVQAIGDRYITITPLQYNLTDATVLKYLYQQEFFNQY
jgi:5'-nucleotidase